MAACVGNVEAEFGKSEKRISAWLFGLYCHKVVDRCMTPIASRQSPKESATHCRPASLSWATILPLHTVQAPLGIANEGEIGRKLRPVVPKSIH